MRKASLIRVLVVDDHAMTRRGLATFLSVYEDLELVGEAADGTAAIQICREMMPDVVLMDMVMPGIDGATATSKIRQRSSQTQVLALTSFKDAALVQKALQAGAIGFLYKDVSADELASAIRAAHAGFGTLSPEATKAMMPPRDSLPQEGDALTTREREVLTLMVAGFSNPTIAENLTVSPSTIKTHVSHILHKLGAATRAEAASLAVRQHIVS
jgi:NarL family two-component system response regulator LiaR